MRLQTREGGATLDSKDMSASIIRPSATRQQNRVTRLAFIRQTQLFKKNFKKKEEKENENEKKKKMYPIFRTFIMLFGGAKYKEIFLRKEYESGFIVFNNAIPWIVVSTLKSVVNWIK